jgi:peroxiredoxin
LVAVSPQLPEHSRRLAKRLQLGFPILFDAGNRTAARYRLTFDFSPELEQVYRGFGLDLPKHHGEGGWTLPMPARYVIDASGMVRQAAVHPDYTQRPEAQASLEALG